jgi:hypothetical protein
VSLKCLAEEIGKETHCAAKFDCCDCLQVAGHHQKEEFAVRGKEPKDEVQIYTWKDATLRELTDLVSLLACDTNRKIDRCSDISEERRVHIHNRN